MFRKVSAEEKLHKELEETLKDELKEFECFAALTSKESKESKTKSGKASSYRRYLCKMAVIFYEAFNVKIETIYSFETLKAYEVLEMHPTFKMYNQKEGRFPSASINSYRAFLAYLHTKNTEDEFIEITTGYIKPEISIEYTLPKDASGKKVKEVSYYERSQKEKVKALNKSKGLCEIDNSHISFISKNTGENYVELHHLLPLSIQNYFSKSIDFEGNLVVLCPNCHRKIHFGEDIERKEMIKRLFAVREQLYKESEIDISLNRLLSFYNIKERSK